jgi:hypothetical protein
MLADFDLRVRSIGSNQVIKIVSPCKVDYYNIIWEKLPKCEDQLAT